MVFLQIFAGIILLDIASSANIIEFDGNFYSPTDISDSFLELTDPLTLPSTLTNCRNDFPNFICYQAAPTKDVYGNRIKVLLLGGFYTHPVSPVLLLRCAEYFDKKTFEDIQETLEVHIVPVVNEKGYEKINNDIADGNGYEEAKINWETSNSVGDCPEGVNIDRCFPYNYRENEDCGEDTANRGNSDQKAETNKVLDLLNANYTFIFVFQSEADKLIIPYASNGTDLNDEDQFVYNKLSMKKVKYNKYYGEYNGTFIDTAINYGSYPIYYGLKRYDKYEVLNDLDDVCETVRGNIMELIKKPKGDINGIFEQDDGSIIALYEFFNYLPSQCNVTFDLKFYFNANDKYELDKCDIVQKDQLGYRSPDRVCDNDAFYSSDKINGVNFDTIGISRGDMIQKYTNYTIKLTFKRENATDYSVKFLSKVQSQANGLRFQTIVNNKTYDIKTAYGSPTKAPRWAIGVIMFGIFILIVFTIVSCVMVKNRSNYFFRLLGQ